MESSRERFIELSGRGRVSARPDTAVVRLGVQNEADSAEAALSGNSEQVSAVISAVTSAGVEEADIQTAGLNLQPIYDRSEEGESPALIGYRAGNFLRITVQDIDQLGQLLDAAVGAGSNTIEGIRFEISNRAALASAAREAAINDALAKAEQLTALAGAELGPVLTITERSGPEPIAVEQAALERAAAAVPIAPGTQTIEAEVRVTWEIR